jgi:hypothetical protein
MSLLAPWLAAFAALAAVPVIIHLLNRRRFKVVRWGAIDFLLRTLQKTKRRLQLQDLILMLLRAAALALVALACARPVLPAGRLAGLVGGGGATTVVVLDNSLSMAVADGGASRFARAKARAAAAVQALPRGSQAALVLMSDVAASELSEPSRDLALVAGLIEKAGQGAGGTAVPVALAKAAELVRGAAGEAGGEIVLVTDCQAVGWPAATDPAWEAVRQALRGCHLVVCDVGGEPPANAALVRLEADDAVVAAGSDCTLVAGVVRRGGGSVPLPVELWADDGRGGALRKVASATAEAGEGARTVRLAHRFAQGGQYRLEARLPPDALAADDRRALVLDVVERVRVCVIAQGQAGGFLKAALAADADGAADGREAIEVALLSPDRLADLNLDDYRAVILAGVADPGRLAEALRTAVGDGRGLVLLPGPDSDPVAWNRGLGELLPAKLSARPQVLAAAGAAGSGFATDRLEHPVTTFFAVPENQPWLAQPRFRQAWGLEPAAGATTVLRLAGGQPWLVERPFGRGVVELAAGPVDKSWSDLPLRPAFLMLMRRLVQHAALGTPPRLNLRVHEPLRLGVPAREAQDRFTLTRPDGASAAVAAGLGPDGRPQIEVGDTGLAGFYAIARAGGATTRFAVEAAPAESDLAHARSEVLAPCLGALPTVWIGPDEDLAARLERARSGLEIWPWILALAAACLVAESLLAARWAPKER